MIYAGGGARQTHSDIFVDKHDVEGGTSERAKRRKKKNARLSSLKAKLDGQSK